MFRTLTYPSSGACDYSVELPHWSYCSWFDVCWSFGEVGLKWYPCCSSFSLQHGYHSKSTTPKIQHTSKKKCPHSTTNPHKITTRTRQLQQYIRSTDNNYTKYNLKLATKHTKQIRILQHVQNVKTPKQDSTVYSFW